MQTMDVIIKRILENHPEIKDEFEANANLSEEEYKQLQSKWYNESIGNLNEEDGIDCEVCKNKGYIEVIKGMYAVMNECECMKRRKLIRRAKKSGLGEYLNKRSKDYIATEDWQEENKEKMIKYCKQENNNWFLLCGQSGSGKTLIASIIANHLLYNLNKNVIYITWTDFISKLKRDMMGAQSKEVSNYLEEIKTIEVLYIDELLKKYNETDLKYIIEIINYRYQNNLKTIITSERCIDELLDIDEATFGRVLEKSGAYIINIKKDRSKNYRVRGVDL